MAIARSLITQPKIIVADEPTGALDSSTSYEVMEILKEINSDGITVVIVTHEHDIAAMTQQIIRLNDGVISEIIRNGELKEWKHQYQKELEIAWRSFQSQSQWTVTVDSHSRNGKPRNFEPGTLNIKL